MNPRNPVWWLLWGLDRATRHRVRPLCNTVALWGES